MPSRSLLLAGLVPLIALLYSQFSNVALWDLARGKNASILSRSKTPIVMASTPAFRSVLLCQCNAKNANTCLSLHSHMEKIITIAAGLVKLGYPVHFLTGPDFEESISSIGATYVPIEGKGHGMMPADKMGTFISLQGDEMEIFAFKTMFTEVIPAQHRTLQRTFASIREQYGEEQPLIFLNDFSFGGIAPVMFGAPGVRPDAVIGVGLAPYPAASNDTFPFQSGKWPDTSPDSKRIHFEAQQERYNTYPDSEWNKNMRKELEAMGTTRSFPSLFDLFVSASDILLQYGIPEFEYPRSDYRPNLKFMGAPVSVGIAERELPEWWDEVVKAKEAGKHVVAVTSSSVVFDNNLLIIPALEALKERDDVLVIATLVTSDVDQLDYKIPANARVAKFIPIDLALPFVSLAVSLLSNMRDRTYD